MRNVVLSLAVLTTFAMIVSSSAQPYLNGAPPGGVGTFSKRLMAIPMIHDGAMTIGVAARQTIGAPTIGARIAQVSGVPGVVTIGAKIVRRMIGAATTVMKRKKTKSKTAKKTPEKTIIDDNDCSMTRNRSNTFSNAPCRR